MQLTQNGSKQMWLTSVAWLTAECTPNPILDWLSPLIRGAHGMYATIAHAHSVEPDVWPLQGQSKWSTAFITDVKCTLNMETRDEWREALLCFPFSPLSQPPSQCMHIPQPNACVLQTAVKQSRLECLTICNAAPGHARCLLPLKTEGKEIINRSWVQCRVGAGMRLCLGEKEITLTPRYFGSSFYFYFTLKLLNTS